MSNFDDSGLDLNQLFLPAWAQQSADVNKYADFVGYEDEKSTGKNRDGRRKDNRSPRGDRGNRTDRPARRGMGRSARFANNEYPQNKDAKDDERTNRPPRSNRNPRQDERRGRFGGGGREERKPLPPLPEVDVQLIPESIVVETLARQIRQSGRAYPLFEIAHIILKRPERLEVAYSTIKKNGQVVQPLYFCSLDRTLWFSEDEAMEYVLKNHFSDFYETQKIPIEGPKGTYTFVAQCGMSGEVFGPPNLHDYQNKVCKFHAERFPNVPFDIYKSRIRIVKDPEVIEKWKEQMSFSLQYNCLQVPDPLVLQDIPSVREHFRQTHLTSVIQKVDTISLTSADIKKQPNHLVSVLYRRLLDEQKRFPLKLVTTLSQKFAAHALQFFKINKTVTHVCISRPHYLDVESTSVSENVKKIMGYVAAHPDCKRADIYKELIPGYDESVVNTPETKAAESNSNVAQEQETSGGDAEAKVEAPVSNLPPEVASALANLNADIHWLIQCGHIIEFYKGNIQVAPKKIAPPTPKNKQKKEKAETKEDSENNAVNATESNTEVKVKEPEMLTSEETQTQEQSADSSVEKKEQ